MNIFILSLLKQIFTIPLYGDSSLGYYYANVYFGNQHAPQSLIFDTGSSFMIIDCNTCEHCGQHLHKPYKIEDSLSQTSPNGFMGMSCKDCTFQVSYLEGSSYEGVLYREQISLDGNLNFQMIIGCVINETNLFYSQEADGIMGLSMNKYNPIGSPSLIDVLKQEYVSKNSKLSICLGKSGGNYFLDWTEKDFVEKINFVDMGNENWEFLYMVTISGFQIGDIKENIFLKGFFDTGTTETYFPEIIYQKLISQIENFCSLNSSNCFGKKQFNECYSRSLWETNLNAIQSSFPIITFYFQNQPYHWHPENYLVFSDSLFCFAFKNDGISSNITFGQSFLLNKNIFIDLEKQKIGWKDSNCSNSKKILSHKFNLHKLNNSLNQKIHLYYQQHGFLERRFKLDNKYLLILLLVVIIFLVINFQKKNKKDPKYRYLNFDSINTNQFDFVIDEFQ